MCELIQVLIWIIDLKFFEDEMSEAEKLYHITSFPLEIQELQPDVSCVVRFFSAIVVQLKSPQTAEGLSTRTLYSQNIT